MQLSPYNFIISFYRHQKIETFRNFLFFILLKQYEINWQNYNIYNSISRKDRYIIPSVFILSNRERIANTLTVNKINGKKKKNKQLPENELCNFWTFFVSWSCVSNAEAAKYTSGFDSIEFLNKFPLRSHCWNRSRGAHEDDQRPCYSLPVTWGDLRREIDFLHDTR